MPNVLKGVNKAYHFDIKPSLKGNAVMKKWVLLFSIITISSVHAASEQQMISESKQAIKAFASQLKTELMAGMQTGGPLQAVSVCNTAAEEIARNNSEKNGWLISRTSLKPRNSKNAPNEWEQAVLESFEKRKAAGDTVSEIEHAEVVLNNGQSEFRYMKAIPTKGMCLVCHGENIAPELTTKIDQLYPQDQARNYKLGDIRGAFSIVRDVQ